MNFWITDLPESARRIEELRTRTDDCFVNLVFVGPTENGQV